MYTNLNKQKLKGIRLVEADLTGAQLGKAKLMGADLRGAVIDRIDFREFELKNVRLDITQAIAVARCYGAKVD